MLRINDLNLLSIERQRTLNDKLSTDSTLFAEDGEDLFMEQEWKGILDPIPFGPQAISLDISFDKQDRLFGIPERINTFSVKNTLSKEDAMTNENEKEPYRLYTSDHFNEKYPNHSTYGAVPILHGLKESFEHMIGFFWCNSSDTYIDVIQAENRKHVHWMSEGGHL